MLGLDKLMIVTIKAEDYRIQDQANHKFLNIFCFLAYMVLMIPKMIKKMLCCLAVKKESI